MITSASIDQHFPSLRKRTYLNTAAESIPPLAVGEALQKYGSDKLLGMDGRDLHFAQEKEARFRAAELLGLSPHEVAFCSCSAEAYNLLASALHVRSKEEVVLSDLDFPSGATPWIATLEKPIIKLWKSREGVLELEDLSSLLSSKTRLVQISLVSFFNGYRIPWEPFVKLVRQRAPHALISVDLTQALGRCVLDCRDADIMISSTHKWLLGIHGGCVVGVPERSAERLTTSAGGWYHLQNAFDADRFEYTKIKKGAASYAVGMPSFAPIYALNAGMRFLLETGISRIADHADPLTRRVHEGLLERGVSPLAPLSGSGIVAFYHPKSEQISKGLRAHDIHIMHHAGRLRISIHGYNTSDDMERFFQVWDQILSV